MSFTPTKKQLDELWITWDYRDSMYKNWLISVILWNYQSRDNQEYKYFIGWEVEFYPESIEDIQTLIRLLSPISTH